MSSINTRLEEISNRIKHSAQSCQRNPKSILLLAVSKTRSVEEIRIAYEAGCTSFGESYIQEALVKISELQAVPLKWHFIGPIQSNKTQAIVKHFDWVHSIDRLKIAERLNDQRVVEAPMLNVCLQVNICMEANKSGVELSKLTELANQVVKLPRLKLRGLMAIPSQSDSQDEQRLPFRHLSTALNNLNTSLFNDGFLKKEESALDTLSMGMSNDFESAVVEGATIIRIGTGLFGPRIEAN
jgi:pyridoxal phosphate enzyme (YggS family)